MLERSWRLSIGITTRHKVASARLELVAGQRTRRLLDYRACRVSSDAGIESGGLGAGEDSGMSRINDKLGFKPAGKRAMIKLPDDPTERANLTAAQCPKCGNRGVRQAVIHKELRRFCSWCSHSWPVVGEARDGRA